MEEQGKDIKISGGDTNYMLVCGINPSKTGKGAGVAIAVQEGFEYVRVKDLTLKRENKYLQILAVDVRRSFQSKSCRFVVTYMPPGNNYSENYKYVSKVLKQWQFLLMKESDFITNKSLKEEAIDIIIGGDMNTEGKNLGDATGKNVHARIGKMIRKFLDKYGHQQYVTVGTDTKSGKEIKDWVIAPIGYVDNLVVLRPNFSHHCEIFADYFF